MIENDVLTLAEAAQGFAAVGSEPRMEVLLCLVRAGADGLVFGDIQKRTGIPASTLNHHLRFLAAAELITQTRIGRQTVSRPDYRRLEALSSFLLARCCADVPGGVHTHEKDCVS
ncbi:MAG: helix-turn-helix transcriptional regulator [Rhodobiaceae bacterium]|nr:helix-turn-helix transcriptional regulator [Rhodobiaceae bacterium]